MLITSLRQRADLLPSREDDCCVRTVSDDLQVETFRQVEEQFKTLESPSKGAGSQAIAHLFGSPGP